MGLFDEHGNLNQQFAQQVYDQASGQVTGAMPAGVPILGAGMKFSEVEAADWAMVDQCIEHVRQPLEAGAPPDAPVMVALLQFSMLMRLLDTLRPVQSTETESDAPKSTNLQTIFDALKDAASHVSRQQIGGKHEQDRADADEWFEKYGDAIAFLRSGEPSDMRLHLDSKTE